MDRFRGEPKESKPIMHCIECGYEMYEGEEIGMLDGDAYHKACIPKDRLNEVSYMDIDEFVDLKIEAMRRDRNED